MSFLFCSHVFWSIFLCEILEDREYQGPELTYSPDQIEIENKNNPLDNQAVFLGVDGTLYDIYYNPIQKGTAVLLFFSNKHERCFALKITKW